MNTDANKFDQLHPDSPPLCLILGGGGARGFAHIGALKAISEAGLPVNRLVGVSMGSLMASMFSLEGDVDQVQCKVMDFLDSAAGRNLTDVVSHAGHFSDKSLKRRWGSRLFRELKKGKALARFLRSQSMLPSTVLREAIDFLVPDIDIRELPTPVQIVTVDLRQGMRVVLSEGSLRRAIRASMSIPGIFPPVHHDGQLLSDIAVFDSVPCDVPPCQRSIACDSETIVAIDVGKRIGAQVDCHSALEAVLRFQALAEQLIRDQSLSRAQWVVRPELINREWFDFRDPQPLIASGYEAALRIMTSTNRPIPPTLPSIQAWTALGSNQFID